jgi:NADP-dependent 3-hydroxy acid dehydrogenase YdfG
MPRKSPERVVVVTGASNGPGRAIALEFALNKEALVLGSRRSGPLDAVRRSCEALHAWTVAQVTDLTDMDEAYALANAALRRFKRVDVWINYAPPMPMHRGDATPVDAFAEGAVLDLQGYENGATAALACFEKLGGGVLINVDFLIGGAPPGCEARCAELRRQVAETFAGIEARARAIPGVRVESVTPSRVPITGEALAPAVVALARAWSRPGMVGELAGALQRSRLALRTRLPVRTKRGSRQELVTAAPADATATAPSGHAERPDEIPARREQPAAPRRPRRKTGLSVTTGGSRRHGTWHVASVAKSREYISTLLLVVGVPLVALAAALMMVS